MNYRHAYHAGNFADVLKHTVLALIIDYLKLKPAPFRVIDTHAGTGNYNLGSEEAIKTGEWREGIGRLLSTPRPQRIENLLTPYISAVLDGVAPDNLKQYPGSPLLARRLLRPDDRLIANELHPADAEDLQHLFARDKQTKITCMDGWTALKAFLPPVERRGVILIDPPFEEAGELDRLVQAAREANRRFATGIVMLWYPIKTPDVIVSFKRQLAELNVHNALCVELMLRAPTDMRALNGSGLIVINPPFTLQDNLSEVLPFFAQILARGEHPSWDVNTLNTASN